MFSFPLERGIASKVFRHPHSTVITSELAETHFNGIDPIGQIVTLTNEMDFTITVIMADFPKNSSINTDVFVDFNLLKELGFYSESWGSKSVMTTYGCAKIQEWRCIPCCAVNALIPCSLFPSID